MMQESVHHVETKVSLVQEVPFQRLCAGRQPGGRAAKREGTLRGAGRRGRLSVDAQSLYVQRARDFPCARSNSLPPDLALKASDLAPVESWAFIRFPIGGQRQGVRVTA